ncbi:2628_t:CDS:2, partial [Racocetra persica]
GVDKLYSSCYIKIIDSERYQKSTINKNNQLNNIDNLTDINKSNISTNIMDINNLIESNEFNITINIVDNMILIDKTNFNQIVKLIAQRDLKIETLIEQNNINLTILNNSELLTTVLLKYQQNNNRYLLDLIQFQQIIETNEPKLIGFFDEIINALIPKKRLTKNKEKAKKQVVAYCYF